MTADRQTYTLVLRPEPGVDPKAALRGLLKVLLQQHGLRCIAIPALVSDARDKWHANLEVISNDQSDRVTGICRVDAGERVDPVVLVIEGILEGGICLRLGLSPADARWLAAELIKQADRAKSTRIRGWRDEST